MPSAEPTRADEQRETREPGVTFEINLNNKEWGTDHQNKSQGIGLEYNSYRMGSGGHKKVLCIQKIEHVWHYDGGRDEEVSWIK